MTERELRVGNINFGPNTSMSELRRSVIQAPVDAAHRLRALEGRIRVLWGLLDGARQWLEVPVDDADDAALVAAFLAEVRAELEKGFA